MNERTTKMEREALLAGDRADTLEPDEAADLPMLAALLADRATWAEPRADLEDAVVRAVVTEESTVPNVPNVTPIGTRRAAVGRRRRMRFPAAAAAAAAVAIVVASLLSTSGGAAPAFTADLAATGLVPAARGSAAIDRNNGGFRITLDASGLMPLPEGEYYEAWVKDQAGTLVPIGTFSSSDARVTLWSGVSPTSFATLTVTIETADGNQASSGQVVLRGAVRPG